MTFDNYFIGGRSVRNTVEYQRPHAHTVDTIDAHKLRQKFETAGTIFERR